MNSSRIGLSLSGGGFRATLFHLGVVRYLHESGLLDRVQLITSVSGGSVLGAHLALNWRRYTSSQEGFNAASKELVRFTMADVRGQIVRRWILAWIAVLPRAFSPGHWKLTNMLKASYGRLFKNATLGSLPIIPEVHLLSTSMTTGDVCSFDRSGVCLGLGPNSRRIAAPAVELAYAVAASSAFPPLFPPIRIDNRILLCDQREFPHAEYLTDGGVYDNLGIEKILDLRADKALDTVIVSDAEGNFDWALERKYISTVSRNIRANDILMRRLSVLHYEAVGPGPEIHRVHIGAVVAGQAAETVPDPGTQRALRNIRTDLDKFSDEEVTALIGHGYTVAQNALSALNLEAKSQETWSGPIGGVQISWDEKRARRSQIRKTRLWALTDWVSWATAGLLGLYCALLAGPILIQQTQLYFLQSENAILADALGNESRTSPSSAPGELSGFYVRKTSRRSAIVFVHGIFGNPRETWTCRSTGAYWPKLLTEDSSFDQFDVYSAGYLSPRFGTSASVNEVAEILYQQFVDKHVTSYENLVFVAHDVGGLIVQSMLLSHRDMLNHVVAIVDYGVPFSGSGFASLARLLSSNKQLTNMTDNEALSALSAAWRAVRPSTRVYCAYETLPILGQIVVGRDSATYGCNVALPIDKSHVDLVKPCSSADVSYVVLKNIVGELRTKAQ